MRRAARWMLRLGFAVEVLRAGGAALIRKLRDCRRIHVRLDWKRIHIFLKNMPAGLKGARFRVDRMNGDTTNKDKD